MKTKDNDISNFKNWYQRHHPKDVDDKDIQEHVRQTVPKAVSNLCAVSQ